jgi:hypothetical protein
MGEASEVVASDAATAKSVENFMVTVVGLGRVD